jgi:quinol monooxygenase YgiN
MQNNCRFVLSILAALVALPAWAQAPAPAAATGPVYGVTYFEALPAAANAVVATVKQFAAASRKKDGNAGYLALREAGRSTRFAVVEGWRDKPVAEAHWKSAADTAKQLQPQLAAPFDTRPSSGMLVAAAPPGTEAAMANAVVVVTHVDVPPPSKDECIGLLKQLTEMSRKDPGVLRFDVLQQDSRPNHFTVVEAWRDGKAQDAHIAAEHTREFRRKLTPLSGALFDERVYRAIR